jgi:23S rRNA G2445 N2-methylase RlmL
MSKTKILVTCPKAIPPLLAEELRALGFPVLREFPAGVETEGRFEDCLKLNLWLRTGHRVLRLIKTFQARNADEMYAQVSEIPWEKHIREDGYLSVMSSVENTTIRDTRFASLRCKDAIVDRIKKECDRRPDSGPLCEGVVVFLYWRQNECSIYFDTSGEPLSKRGYRKIPLQAPMQETLAAAVVLASGWRGDKSFVNPMCGSGTLAIEAALIGLGRAPGLTRTNFAFMHLKEFDPGAWEMLRSEAVSAAADSLPVKIIATDIDAGAVQAARQNAEAAGVEKFIEFSACDFAETLVPEGGGVIVFNPEYGERMGETQALVPVYRRIGDFLKRNCKGYNGCVFTGNAKLFNKVGLKPTRQRTFFNSNIECRLLEFEIY